MRHGPERAGGQRPGGDARGGGAGDAGGARLCRVRADGGKPAGGDLRPCRSTCTCASPRCSRNLTRDLGVNWSALARYRALCDLRPGGGGEPARRPSTVATLPNGVLAGGYNFNTPGRAVNINAVIDALAQDQLVRVLAEPNLTAMSGETASFLVGGEFPDPGRRSRTTPSRSSSSSTASALAFVPTVLSDGRISLQVRPEVSQLTTQGAVTLGAGNSTIQVPALTVRRAETTVELGSGQSFAIAGLLQDTTTINRTNGVPVLGDVPILGALFRSDSFQRNETELVIIVTPYIVRPVSAIPPRCTLPTDGWTAPNDLERILLLRQTGRGDGRGRHGSRPHPGRCRIHRAMTRAATTPAKGRTPMPIRYSAVLALLLLAGGCTQMNPYTRDGDWRPSDSNDRNLRAMVMSPSISPWGRGPQRLDGQTAVQALDRQRLEHVRRLPDSAVANVDAGGDRRRKSSDGGNADGPPTILARGGRGGRRPPGPTGPRLVAFVARRRDRGGAARGPAGIAAARASICAAAASAPPSPHCSKCPRRASLIVDVSGEEQPLTALARPVAGGRARRARAGDRRPHRRSRFLSPGHPRPGRAGIPLQAAHARHRGAAFRPAHRCGRARPPQKRAGGRVVTVTGVRGGVGATTLAANLAWHFGVTRDRHTVLLDADLHRGTGAMLLDARSRPRPAHRAGDAGADRRAVRRTRGPAGLQTGCTCWPARRSWPTSPATPQDAAPRLLDALRRRYNFVVCRRAVRRRCRCIATCSTLAHQRVLVMEPTLASVRDTLRLLALPHGPDAAAARRAGAQPRRPPRRPDPPRRWRRR